MTIKEYDEKVEERLIYSTDNQLTQFVVIIDKKTGVVTVIDRSNVDSTQPTSSSISFTLTTLQEVYDRDENLREAIKSVNTKYS